MPCLVKDLETIVNSLKEKDIQEIEFDTMGTYMGIYSPSPIVIKISGKDNIYTLRRNENEPGILYREPTLTTTNLVERKNK